MNNLSKYRLNKKLLTIFEHLTDEQKIEKAIQEYSIEDIVRILTYYELGQYTYAKNMFLEKYIHNKYRLVYYSRSIIGGRWPEAEPAIMTDPEYAFLYSYEIIRGRWPEAEPTIIKDATYAYRYSCDVIKGRWPEAEPTIMADPYWWNVYLSDILGI